MKHTTVRFRRAGAIMLACAAILAASACDARERAADRRNGDPAVVHDDGNDAPINTAPNADSRVSDAELDEIDALLNEIEADLVQAEHDLVTSEGDVE